MAKIICLMGKSCSGKDTIYKRIKDSLKELEILVPYTTRPRRTKEIEGEEYHFVSEAQYEKLSTDEMILEERAYNTVHGIWRYFTVRDEALDAAMKHEDGTDYLYIGTLEAYTALKQVWGKEHVVPIYIECDPGDRLERALRRERKQSEPKFAELCRRFLADEEDFSEEKLAQAGIDAEDRFMNTEGALDDCLMKVLERIKQ